MTRAAASDGESALIEDVVQGRWPADGANSTAQRLGRGVVTVVPVTPNTDRIHPFQVLLLAEQTGLVLDSKAQAEQIRSAAVERIGTRAGLVPADILATLDEALRLHLAL